MTWYDDFDSWDHGLTRTRDPVEDIEIRDPSVRHALDAILARVRGEPAPSEEGEARRAIAALAGGE